MPALPVVNEENFINVLEKFCVYEETTAIIN